MVKCEAYQQTVFRDGTPRRRLWQRLNRQWLTQVACTKGHVSAAKSFPLRRLQSASGTRAATGRSALAALALRKATRLKSRQARHF